MHALPTSPTSTRQETAGRSSNAGHLGQSQRSDCSKMSRSHPVNDGGHLLEKDKGQLFVVFVILFSFRLYNSKDTAKYLYSYYQAHKELFS